MADDSQSRAYAHLPEDLIRQILDDVPNTVNKMNRMFAAEEAPMNEAMNQLREDDLIHKADDTDYWDSVVAVDGGHVIEKMAGVDTVLAAAVGVAGLAKHTAPRWENQFLQWQDALPHEEATPRLCQGAMFIMELIALANAANADRKVCIMDGTHFTPILKINSMLSASEENAGEVYIESLRRFLKEKFNKEIVPDIPNIIDAALKKEEIIAMPKYSSSRDVLDGVVERKDIIVDDKTFFASRLKADEYVGPFAAGQSRKEASIWGKLHIKCKFAIEERDELNSLLRKVIAPVRARHRSHPLGHKESSIWFTYYKPYKEGPAYRIECKAELAKDKKKFHRMLASVKRQVVYPDILEPYPQHVADLMAKSVSGGMYALQDAIRLSQDLDIRNLPLLLHYRSK